MGQVLHGSATTTEAVRRAIQRSQESLRALAKRFGINQKTVAKWRNRNSVADEIHTPMLEAGIKRSGRALADLDKRVPYGRIGKPEDVAALVAFLASEEAPFICGSLVEITVAQAVA